MLTDQKIRGGRQLNYVIERNWEFVEGLKCPRLNYGMGQKTETQDPPAAATENDESERQPPAKRAKHIRFD